MTPIAPSLCEQYGLLIEFLAAQPQFAANPRKKSIEIGTRDYITNNAEKFAKSREKKDPSIPQTAQDMMVPFIMQEYFNIPPENSQRSGDNWHDFPAQNHNLSEEGFRHFVTRYFRV